MTPDEFHETEEFPLVAVPMFLAMAAVLFVVGSVVGMTTNVVFEFINLAESKRADRRK